MQIEQGLHRQFRRVRVEGAEALVDKQGVERNVAGLGLHHIRKPQCQCREEALAPRQGGQRPRGDPC